MKPRIFLSAAITAAIVIVVICGLVLWKVPIVQIASLRNAKGVDTEDVFKAENEARATLAQTIATLAQIVGGFAVLIGAYFAWRNLTATARNLELTNRNLELTKEGQVTERFTKAIDQLGATDDEGKPKLELRLGGIYGLERIARESERDHWPIMEVLTAYVREHATHNTRPDYLDLAADIQAILTVLRRREWRYEKSDQQFDLHQTDLRRADLHGAHLEGANLDGLNLEGANLEGAHLDYAHLWETNLVAASLHGAHLKNADLEGPALEDAHARLAYADLTNANLENANLIPRGSNGRELAGRELAGHEPDGRRPIWHGPELRAQPDPAADRFSL